MGAPRGHLARPMGSVRVSGRADIPGLITRVYGTLSRFLSLKLLNPDMQALLQTRFVDGTLRLGSIR